MEALGDYLFDPFQGPQIGRVPRFQRTFEQDFDKLLFLLLRESRRASRSRLEPKPLQTMFAVLLVPPHDGAQGKTAWAEARCEELDNGDVESLIRAIKRLRPSGNEGKKLCEAAIGYYTHNMHRMHYAQFRQKGLFIGSGVLEAGCRMVIGQRLKLSGMHWTLRGLIALLTSDAAFSVTSGKIFGHIRLLPDFSTHIYVAHPPISSFLTFCQFLVIFSAV